MRACKDGWINAYLRTTEGQESPLKFHQWTAISVLSSAMRRNVWLDRGFGNLYPNLYIVLVGASAMCHKTTAVKIGKRILQATNDKVSTVSEETHIFAQKLTPQALIHFLSERNPSQAVAICEELTTFLDLNAIQSGMVPVLLELYDNPEGRWKYTTLSRGEEILYDPSICLLGATTPVSLKKSFPEESIGEGLVSRFIFVYGERPGPPQAHPRPPEGYEVLKSRLIDDLTRIKSLKGAFRWGTGAEKWYSKWYDENYEMPEKCTLDMAYWVRRRDFILKIAMLISASKGDELILDIASLEAALGLLLENEPTMSVVAASIKVTDFATLMNSVFEVIAASKEDGIGRSILLRKVSYYLDDGVTTFNTILQSLRDSEMIEEFYSGRTVYYRVKDITY